MIPLNNVCAALLCGGQSKRLGYPKEMLRVDGEPLAAKMAERLQRLCGVYSTKLRVGRSYSSRPPIASVDGARVLPNRSHSPSRV